MSFAARCVLFDLDGTLVDTAPDLGHAANCVREDLGLVPLEIADYRPVASAGARGLLWVALGMRPEHPDFPARRDDFLNYYKENIARGSALFEGMDEVLKEFERRDILWGVATNKPGWLTQLLLDALDLSLRCSCSFSPNESIKAKPAPDMLLAACEQLRLTVADCVYVGDDKRDIDAGRAAGMRTMAADWGYLGEGGPIASWGADVVVATPVEMGKLILGSQA